MEQNIVGVRGVFGSPNGWVVPAGVLFCLSVTAIFLQPIDHDVGFFLYAAGRVLDGARLYRDIVEMNPPLIYFVNVPPVWVGRLVGWSDVTVFRIYVLLLVMVCLWMCWRELRGNGEPSVVTVRRCVLLALLFLLLRPYFFGQREHILAVLVTPYIISSAGIAAGSRINKGRIGLVMGVAAGIGFALKPYFLPVWMMIESYLILVKGKRSSWRRPENIGIILVHIGYGAAVVFLTPEYIKEIVPMMTEVYGAYSCDISYLLQHPYTGLWLLAFLLFLTVRPSIETRELRRVFLIASGGFLLVAFVQRKGFYYHFYPAAVISVLLLVVVSVDGLETIGPIRRLLGAPRVVAVHVVVWGLLVLSCAKSIQYWQQRNPPLLSPLIRIAEEHAKGRSILLLSSSIFPSFPLVNYSRVGWSSRFANMWVLPNVYSGVRELEGKFPYHKRSEMDGLERWFVDAVISDMVRSQPVLVICDCSQKKQGFGKTTFDYIEYFLKDQRFAEMWRNYSLLTSVDDYRVFKMKKERVIGVENAAANG